ncbi:peptidase M22, glycoprotease [Cylindrobasidium torrendii FP15055 ss-10]|uniref:N(6)-L-threonylcarbamoyladenine synthase n=1 Tax=Cylindrobasidium torrendii FP15055 ss-10 TaxID=1314674 RepID=A0A0D7BKN5_9AGAR|nr:peptidase M22, glycoprotease [Cylindrobasidium torrendii FP15055 ss-10]
MAFETSADDTCAAVVTSDMKILSNVVIKQTEIHAQFGGIQPTNAVLAHQRNAPVAAKRALVEAGLTIKDIDGIAFTKGPGMGVCLGVGSQTAKAIAAIHDIPVVGVHHMQGHALTALLTSQPNPPQFPFLALLVSGGHNMLVLVKAADEFEIVANTLDTTVGRVLDKLTRELGLGYTGQQLEQFYTTCKATPVVPEDFGPFGQPMLKRAWSFSAHHSHMERYMHKRQANGQPDLTDGERLGLIDRLMQAVGEHLTRPFRDVLMDLVARNIKVNDLVVGGGVASNLYLRRRIEQAARDRTAGQPGMRVHYPPPALCTDNAVMIAVASMHRFLKGDFDDLSCAPNTKWSIEDCKLTRVP